MSEQPFSAPPEPVIDHLVQRVASEVRQVAVLTAAATDLRRELREVSERLEYGRQLVRDGANQELLTAWASE